MDAITRARAEKLADMLDTVAWYNDPIQTLSAATQDEFGRWRIPGVYDSKAVPGEDDNGTLWRLLAAVHNSNPGIELDEALPICRAIMGEKIVSDAPALKQLAGFILVLIQLFRFHIDDIDPSIEMTLTAAHEMAHLYEKGRP